MISCCCWEDLKRRAKNAITSRENVGPFGYDGGPVQDALPAEQVLRRTGSNAQRPNRQNVARSVQSGSGCFERSGSARAEIHLLSGRVQWPLRGTRSRFAGRVRSRPLSQSNGRFQFCRRRNSARLRRPQTQRRTKEIHVLVGRIHNSFRILVRQKDPIPVPNARRPGALNNRKPRE